jgi:hypothetical protein
MVMLRKTVLVYAAAHQFWRLSVKIQMGMD